MITIIDYGVGNVRAFLNAFKLLNVDARAVRTKDELADTTRVILPGVGAFDHAMESLEHSGMRETLDELVLRRGVPVLGVCVGMQMLGMSSEEGGRPGLGWINGRVRGMRALDASGDMRLPHMGWNDVHPTAGVRLFEGLENGSRFYFLHSFYFECVREENTAAVATYGTEFSCAVHSGNIYGVQFHPEKSHQFGTRLLKNFAAL
ncbi:MAG TPA: imidazole glycerol phosphate synthase subunit HisH [Gemmatimonadaceae bacterium]|nr:imidazole glycerol phosphate synthase subunit HisH [Gemmatimonadaceae bacterium]